MAGKVALFYMLDVGTGIDKPYDQKMTRLRIALNCMQQDLMQKLANNPNNEISFGIFGDTESDDGNNSLLYPLQKPTLDLLRKIRQMSMARMDSQKPGGDIFSAIEHIILTAREHINKKNYNKRAFLFTCGEGKTQYNLDEIRNIAANLEEDGIKLNIIPIGFMKTYDIFQNTLDNEKFEVYEQKINAELLMKLKQFSSSNVQIFSSDIAIELYKKFRVKDTNPVVLYKGDFEIAPGLRIPVGTYKCIRKQRLAPFGKYDMTIPFDQNLTKEKEVINDVAYTCEDDETGEIIEKEHIINAYQYGMNLIPVNNIIAPSMKTYEEKNFTLLGFVDQKKIPRWSLMSEVEIVVPTNTGKKSQEEMTIAQKLFTALVISMKRAKRYAVARYVSRNSKSGVNPRMVTLIPHMTDDRVMLYLVDIPTVEDVREYPFNPLKQATETQTEAIKALVEKMMLLEVKEDGQEQDLLKIENTPNPVKQYFFQSLFHRAVSNESEEIPELDPVIKNYITPERKIYSETSGLVPELVKEFRLVKKELAKEKLKQAVVNWKDINLSTNCDTDQYSESSYNQAKNKWTIDNDKGEEFDPNDPIQSFRGMLTNNKMDLVQNALNEMRGYIEKRSKNVQTTLEWENLVECSIKLREGCMEQKEQKFWDDWFHELEKKSPKLQDKLKERGYGYLDLKRNTEYFAKIDDFTQVEINNETNDDLD